MSDQPNCKHEWVTLMTRAGVPEVRVCRYCCLDYRSQAHPASTDQPDPVNHPAHYPKQARYQDESGDDWIDEFARTATPEEFRGAMRFTIGKYNRRAGKKDELIAEIRKMNDYCGRWLAYEEGRS